MTDSIKKLSIPVQAFRAKIVAYLMTPKPAGEGIVAVRQLTLRLKKLVDEACRRMYDQDWKPENVSVNFLHLKSWETITSKMNISGKSSLFCIGKSQKVLLRRFGPQRAQGV